MQITAIEIYKYSIPMHPFTIATGTMHFAQNIFIRVQTDAGITGVGECSAFPMIVGETQNTCFEMAKDFAQLWKGKDALDIESRMQELHLFTAGNSTAKSAFDMALYDIAAKHQQQPLYVFLGGKKKPLETDLTIGIHTATEMAEQAKDFIRRGVRIQRSAVRIGGLYRKASYLDTLAAAYAETGDFESAIKYEQQAIAAQTKFDKLSDGDGALNTYRQHRPFRTHPAKES